MAYPIFYPTVKSNAAMGDNVYLLMIPGFFLEYLHTE